MSVLIVEDLSSSPTTQLFRIDRSLTCAGIRCYLALIDRPDGDLTLTIKKGANTLAVKSQDLSEITVPQLGDQSHGYLYFKFDESVRLGHLPTLEWTEYQIELEVQGLTQGSVSWVKDYTSSVNTYPDPSPRDLDSPYTFQIIEWK